MRIKNRLNKELDGMVKSFDRNERLASRAKSAQISSATRPFSKKKAWIGSLSAVLAAAVAVLVLCLTLPAKAPVTEYFTVEINPSAVICVTDGKVSRVVSLNSDSDVLLSDGFADSLKGKSAADAATDYVDRAVMLGYIDPNGVAAVKFGTQSDEMSDKLRGALDGYFMSSGVYAAVAAVKLDETLLNDVNGADVYALRGIENMSGDELSASFAANTESTVSKVMRSGLTARIDKMSEYKRIVDELSALNELIQDHADNPVVLSAVKDYFVVTSLSFLYPPSLYTEDFASLMNEFGDLLDEYAELGGCEISSGIALETVRIAFAAMPLEQLRQLAEGLDEITEALREPVSQILMYTGYDVSEIMDISESMPTTAEEYAEKTFALYSAEAKTLIADNKESYEQSRPQLTSEQYESFVAGIINEYGSLANYFDSVNEKN